MAAQEDNLTRMNSSVDGTDDREAYSKFWIAAYTRPRSEKKTASELAKLGIETYVPIQKQIRTWSDRKKYIDVVVIPMVIFANINENDILSVKQHSLVIRVLSYPGKREPAHIPQIQIDNLKILLGQTKDSVEFIGDNFSTKDKVLVVKGALRGLIGEVKEVLNEITTLWIGVDLLGGAIVRLSTSELEHYE